MSRQLSATALASAFAQETAEVWLVFLTLTHAGLEEPVRLVANEEDITRGGVTYVGFPFEIVLPVDDGERLPGAQLRVANADRLIMDQIRNTITQGAPEVEIAVALATSPDLTEYGPLRLSLSNVSYDAFFITGTLGGEDALSRRYPRHAFDNPGFPALCPG